MDLRYTRRADVKGWLKVLLVGGQNAFLPEYTQVDVLGRKNGRTYFVIRDGYVAVGRQASLADGNADRYLSRAGPVGAAEVVVTYRGRPVEHRSAFKGLLLQQFANLSFAGQTALVTLNSVWDGQYTPIPPGAHSILGPDNSHAKIATTGYRDATPGMVGNDVWFPIGLNGTLVNSSRYIHVGHLSEGCVTVHQLERWAALYNYLISHRVAGSRGRRVGRLIVRR